LSFKRFTVTQLHRLIRICHNLALKFKDFKVLTCNVIRLTIYQQTIESTILQIFIVQSEAEDIYRLICRSCEKMISLFMIESLICQTKVWIITMMH